MVYDCIKILIRTQTFWPRKMVVKPYPAPKKIIHFTKHFDFQNLNDQSISNLRTYGFQRGFPQFGNSYLFAKKTQDHDAIQPAWHMIHGILTYLKCPPLPSKPSVNENSKTSWNFRILCWMGSTLLEKALRALLKSSITSVVWSEGYPLRKGRCDFRCLFNKL